MCHFTDEEMGSERIRLAQVAGERQSQRGPVSSAVVWAPELPDAGVPAS